ncbi:hypothetical protein [Pseudogulbenkiania ferrooxidans]|uniref:Uncharacterized protein n=1 Tax=Pseudogulbenkiania ferrooxidans EGD-HP2 TaxID=1388764 RepID=A0ABP2XRP2_9NEIS|nr:hypothetical protein [Pseudogulbenkiania ferrooxidans]ERE13935.1 hypothetical protein O166_04215 [Pseudogulbenkiania ferrooxidans EGD-HP2]
MAASIDPNLVLPPHQDFAALSEEAIAFITAQPGNAWTDVNPSEPGVTLLEGALAGLTDLGYRLDHQMADLLAPAGAEADWQPLPPIDQALPTQPVSLDDLQKILTDHPLLSAARLQPAAAGHYQLRLTPIRALSDTEQMQVRQEIWRRFQAARPLGMLLDTITFLSEAKLKLYPELELAEGAPVEATLAALVASWQRLLAAPPVYAAAADCLAAGQSGDEVFDGPLLNLGVKKIQPPAPTQVLSSQLIDLALAIPGIAQVSSLLLGDSDGRRVDNAWSWTVPDNHFISLDLDTLLPWWAGQLTLPKQSYDPLHRKGQRLRVNLAELRALLAVPPLKPTSQASLPAPFGRYRRLSDFPAFSQGLPAQFGISASGLNPAATPAEQAMTLQLQAYLLLLEQQQSDQAAQLENIRRLLELPAGDWLARLRALFVRMLGSEALSDADADRFWDTVRGLPASILRQGAQPLPLAEQLLAPADLPAYRQAGGEPVLEDVLSERWLDRTLRRLQHLAARFGETLPDAAQLRYRGVFGHYSPLLLASRHAPVPALDADTLTRRLASLKQALDLAGFLLAFPRLSGGRGQGADLAASLHSRSGLELRVAARLGITLDDGDLSLGKREGLYLVEGVLLAAGPDSEPVLSLANAVFWILPAEGSRLGDPSFRRLVEQVICEETPLHLTPWVCWLGGGDLNRMETLHRHWRAKWREMGGPAAPSPDKPCPDQTGHDLSKPTPAPAAPGSWSRRRRLQDCSAALQRALLQAAFPIGDAAAWQSHIAVSQLDANFTVGYPLVPQRRTVAFGRRIGDPAKPYVVAFSPALPLND